MDKSLLVQFVPTNQINFGAKLANLLTSERKTS